MAGPFAGQLAEALGASATERVRAHYPGLHSLMRYARVIEEHAG